MTYRPTIVVVDDNPRVLENFMDEADASNISLEVFESWDLAKEFLENSQFVDGIVLDAKGKLTADKQESTAHLQQALAWIALQKGGGRIIPYAVHTAFYDDMEAFSGEQDAGTMFRKGNKSEKLVLEYLKTRILETPRLKLIAKYPTAFEALNKGYIKREFEGQVLEMFSCLEKKDYRKKNLGDVRDNLEAVFITLMDSYECIPDNFASLKDGKRRPNLEWCTRFLEGKETNGFYLSDLGLHQNVPVYVSSSIRYIKERTSEYSHVTDEDVCRTQFISASFSMLEVLEWLPNFIESNFEY